MLCMATEGWEKGTMKQLLVAVSSCRHEDMYECHHIHAPMNLTWVPYSTQHKMDRKIKWTLRFFFLFKRTGCQQLAAWSSQKNDKNKTTWVQWVTEELVSGEDGDVKVKIKANGGKAAHEEQQHSVWEAHKQEKNRGELT